MVAAPLDGDAKPAASYTSAVNGGESRYVAVVDVNGDARLDIVASIYTAPTGYSVLLNNGNGTFKAASQSALAGKAEDIVAADFNWDGKTDLAVSLANSAKVNLLVGNGDGAFQNPVSLAVGNIPGGMAAVDFNRDGWTDLAVANQGSDSVSVLLNNRAGALQAAVHYPFSAPHRVRAGDFDHDGRVDLAVSGQKGLGVLRGAGDGTFQKAIDLGAFAKPYTLFVADFDRDGRDDIAAHLLDGSSVAVLLNRSR